MHLPKSFTATATTMPCKQHETQVRRSRRLHPLVCITYCMYVFVRIIVQFLSVSQYRHVRFLLRLQHCHRHDHFSAIWACCYTSHRNPPDSRDCARCRIYAVPNLSNNILNYARSRKEAWMGISRSCNLTMTRQPSSKAL